MLQIEASQTRDDSVASPAVAAGTRTTGPVAEALCGRVIPYLHRLYSVDPPHAAPIDGDVLARRCAGEDGMDAAMRALNDAGATPDAILYHWLPDLARRLGRFWADDTMSFVDVTIGMGRITRAARALQATDAAPAAGPLALVSPPPGAQHRFGALLVEIALRRAGWRVHAGPFDSESALTGELGARPYRLFALSVGSTEELPRCRALIGAARAARPGVTVMAGGAAFSGDLDPVDALGADAGAGDARAVAAAAAPPQLPAGT